MKFFVSIFIVLAMVFSVILLVSDEEDLEKYKEMVGLVEKQSEQSFKTSDEEDLEKYKEMMELVEKQSEQSLKVIESLTKPGGMLDKNESLLEFLNKTKNERDNKINLQVEKLDAEIIKTVELIEKNSLLEAKINAMMVNWRKLGVPQDQELKSHYENIRKELIESINVAKNK